MALSVEESNIGYLPSGFNDIPEAVFHHILSYLTAPEILQAVQVCTAWQAIIDRQNFWFKIVNQKIRLHPYYNEIKLILKSKELTQSCPADILRFLKGICLNRDDPSYFLSYIRGTKNNMDIENSWDIDEEDIMAVSVLLLFRKPQIIDLELRSDPARIRFMDVFLLVLESHKYCVISIKNLGGWRSLLNSNKQPLKQVEAYERCDLNWLQTTVVDIAALPRGVSFLWLGILQDESGRAINPGLERLNSHCTELEHLGVHIRAGADLNDLGPPPDKKPWLYISGLQEDNLDWAIKAAQKLQPSGGSYYGLSLPSCGLETVSQLVTLVQCLFQADVRVDWPLSVSTPGRPWRTDEEQEQLKKACKAALKTRNVFWCENDDHLPDW